MAGRRLDADERASWNRVTATVTPLKARDAGARPLDPPAPTAAAQTGSRLRAGMAKELAERPRPAFQKPAPVSDTLDGGWDRRLRRGAVAPDRAIDLHGHTLATAHSALEQALADALADDVRVLLVVTGKPPRAGEARRGLIRASIAGWLAGSPHGPRIAAVRNAHPRHGGAGALYLILRRRRGG